jgi:cis-3-alkyl-4-acyloxetan-2-one decarboxylase
MIPADETFDGTFPFAPHFSDAPGFRMHYVDEGEGEVIVCLHGEPTWGYLYRNFVTAMRKRHRVVVPDHMGFGKSETPPETPGRKYRLGTHIDNFEALALDLDLRDITFVIQDWGGPIAGGFAFRYPDRVKRFCLINTVLPLGLPIEKELFPQGAESDWFQWVKKAREDGTYEQVLGNLGLTILSVMKLMGLQNREVIDETWRRAYGGHFQSKADCTAAIEFPLDFAEARAKFETGGAREVETIRSKPAMLAEGMQDRAIPPKIPLTHFRAAFPKGPVVELENAGHFCQEDAPETLIALIEQFIQMT